MVNGLRGRLVVDDSPIDIPLNGKQMQLALDRSPNLNRSWDLMCDSLPWDPRGKMHIDFMIVNGVARVFH